MLLLAYPFAHGADPTNWSRRRLSLDTLIALGALTAFGVSAVHTIRGVGYVYFDIATMLPALVTVGKLLEATAKVRTGRLIRELETLLPTIGPAAGTRRAAEVPLDELRPGRSPPRPSGRAIRRRWHDSRRGHHDRRGRLYRRTAAARRRPRRRGPGGHGQRPGQRRRRGRPGGPGLAASPDHRTDRGRPAKPLARRAALPNASPEMFMPLVLALALAAGVVWWDTPGLAQAGAVALAVLVVACPCAMGIAAPLATAPGRRPRRPPRRRRSRRRRPGAARAKSTRSFSTKPAPSPPASRHFRQ